MSPSPSSPPTYIYIFPIAVVVVWIAKCVFGRCWGEKETSGWGTEGRLTMVGQQGDAVTTGEGTAPRRLLPDLPLNPSPHPSPPYSSVAQPSHTYAQLRTPADPAPVPPTRRSRTSLPAGDSGSEGYTSISVREPLKELKEQQQTVMGQQQQSDDSDSTYAAITDPAPHYSTLLPHRVHSPLPPVPPIYAQIEDSAQPQPSSSQRRWSKADVNYSEFDVVNEGYARVGDEDAPPLHAYTELPAHGYEELKTRQTRHGYEKLKRSTAAAEEEPVLYEDIEPRVGNGDVAVSSGAAVEEQVAPPSGAAAEEVAPPSGAAAEQVAPPSGAAEQLYARIDKSKKKRRDIEYV